MRLSKEDIAKVDDVIARGKAEAEQRIIDKQTNGLSSVRVGDDFQLVIIGSDKSRTLHGRSRVGKMAYNGKVFTAEDVDGVGIKSGNFLFIPRYFRAVNISIQTGLANRENK